MTDSTSLRIGSPKATSSRTSSPDVEERDDTNIRFVFEDPRFGVIDPFKDIIYCTPENDFKLHGLPVPELGSIVGVVGRNFLGKSISLKLLAGKLKPNLGRFKNCPDWEEILTHFEGTKLLNYFIRISKGNMEVAIKRQDIIVEFFKRPTFFVWQLLDLDDMKDMKAEYFHNLGLSELVDREREHLSCGEMQRLAITLTVAKKADVYMFDEPLRYLDLKQRLKIGKVISSLIKPNNYVMIVEHDLSFLEHVSDTIFCFYGKPNSYGVVTPPLCVEQGIDIFCDGFSPIRKPMFREQPFKFGETSNDKTEALQGYKYPKITKRFTNFFLSISAGELIPSEIIVVLGENGTGKTTFLRILAGLLKADNNEGSNVEMPEFIVSYKPQIMCSKFSSSEFDFISNDQVTVRQLLEQGIPESYMYPQFTSNVIKPLQVEQLMYRKVAFLSSDQLERVALCLCLGKRADIYLIDEPSACLDSAQRIVASNVIKTFIRKSKKTALVVENDFFVATYLADKVIVFQGTPCMHCVAREPESLMFGINNFLSHLDLTFRRDPFTYRPRINKLNSPFNYQMDLSNPNISDYYYSCP